MDRVLIICRGEIAVRAVQACRQLGLEPIVGVSEADRDGLATRLAKRSIVLGGPRAADSYLNLDAIRRVIADEKVRLVYPGYGFLAENPELPALCDATGTTFVGPSSDVIHQMGDKIRAKELALEAGLETVPSSGRLSSAAEAAEEADRIGFPVILKAAAGGGGGGMRILNGADQVQASFESATSEAKAAFGSGDLYIEKYVAEARHVEVQVIADGHGRTSHLWDRDCSIQRRYQKVVEEGPAAAISAELRERMTSGARRLAAKVGYQNAGTVEFIVDTVAGKAYFMEMNTRIQVEHPVTEEILGLDLVAEQLRIALGDPLSFGDPPPQPAGHAIEMRLTAETPIGFRPSPGRITSWSPPTFRGVRVDSQCYSGYMIPPYYDSMIAKIIVSAPSRAQAVDLATDALDEFRITGPANTLPFLRDIVRHPDFRENVVSTAWLERLTEADLPETYMQEGLAT